LSANPVTDRLYGLYGGELYELYDDYGWLDEDGNLDAGTTFRLETAKIQLSDFCHYEQVRIDYIGNLTAEIYVDDTLMATHSLSSATRSEERLGIDVGGAGRFLQLKIYGTASSQNIPKIYMPVMIYFSPGEDDA
jgi:hypothetical protein